MCGKGEKNLESIEYGGKINFCVFPCQCNSIDYQQFCTVSDLGRQPVSIDGGDNVYF